MRLFVGDLDRMIEEAEKLLTLASENLERGRWPEDLARLQALVENIKELDAQRRWLAGLPLASGAIN